MPVIKHSLYIQAPVGVCFDLARNVDIHTKTTYSTKEEAVGGVTEGLMEEGDSVTWEATHFGIRQRLTAKIIRMDRPNEFVDVMVKGAFKSFTHTHQFIDDENGTLMIDIFEYESPLGVLGRLADRLFLEDYMKKFIIQRAEELKKFAEQV
ncbi:SRPBCC family protein [Halobacillus litoralis]|uniref:SRPBCC family protein n=1 Tax=Halobacillus litoralis TaxID=45668 RepID=UPI001CFE0CB0|nr:SRPBCC family protein [Halobacillus litoralis]